jgi:uroporphyrinogen decarboxylase
VIEDRGDHEVFQQSDGVQVLRRKLMSSIPERQGYILVDRESWRKHYAPRLDPSHPGRYPDDWDKRVKEWTNPKRERVIGLNAGSLYGWIRNWAGVENISLTVYDDPAWYEEMVETVTDCIMGTLSRALETGGHFDAAFIWEDMAYRAGPLLGPKQFRKFLVPHYRRLTDLLRKHGVDIICVDCDGKIDLLVPLWLEAGVNCIYPIEIGTWQADPIRFRSQYGRDMLMMGGVDKHLLAGTKEAIKKEVYRLAPLVEEGGYIPFCDHRVPPDVPLENYWFYLETIREVWGKGVDLRPMGKLRPAKM